MNRYLIIGNGVAGTTAAEAIRQQDGTGSITLITDEDLPFYYRIRLPEFVAGAISEAQLLAKKPDWYAARGITLLTGRRVLTVDPQTKSASTDREGAIPYDRLLIATGSHSFVPPITGADRTGVFTLRNISDARAIRAYAAGAEQVLAIGGGLLGLEAGQALRSLGKKVTVVEFFPRLLPRQLDNEGANRLKQIMETRLGFSFRLAARTKEIVGEEGVTGVVLESGESLPCEMVLLSAGVRPNLDLAIAIGLDHDKGIRVNERMETSHPDIFAAGDVAEFAGQAPTGIWPAAMEQGKVAGQVMAGGAAVYHGSTMANKLKVVGIDLATAGDIDADNRYESHITATDSSYRKIVTNNKKVIGCILLGDISDYGRLTRAITEQTELSP